MIMKLSNSPKLKLNVSSMFRLDVQGLPSEIVNNSEDPTLLEKFIEDAGLKIKNMVYSSYGQCFFIEAEGQIINKNKAIVKLEARPKDFDWKSYSD